MFTSIVIRITPTEATTAPANTGPAVQGWFLNLVRAHDPRLSAALHKGDGPRPYTLSDVVGLGPIREGRRQLSPEQSGWLRITTLTDEFSVLLIERIAPMLPGAILDLDQAFVRLESVYFTPEEHPWAGRAAPESLVAAGSLSADMPPRLSLCFASPTVFKSEDVYVPLPTPDLVFGSLLDRWNAFAPISLNPEARRFAEARVAVSHYRLQTRHLSYPGSPLGTMRGCVGMCCYHVLSRDRYWVGTIRTLAAFAFFAGVGKRTTIGMGQVAQWDEKNKRPVFTYNIT